VLTNSFRASMALVAIWYAAAGAAVLGLGLRRRVLRAPLWAGYGIAAAAVGVFLAWSTLRDREVHEPLPVGVTLRSGAFVSGEHDTSGTAAVVRRRDGRVFLTLNDLDTSPGPDLRVRVGPGDRDLGALKGNRGDQRYELPRGADVSSVTIWCRAFSVAFGSARLTPA
jgi:hypothetical protein